jgi:hypothetical protein
MKEGVAEEAGVLAAGIEKVRVVRVGSEDVVAAGKYHESLFVATLGEELLLENQSAEAVEKAGADRESRLAAEQGLLEEKWVAESSDSEQKTRDIDTLVDPVPTETL